MNMHVGNPMQCLIMLNRVPLSLYDKISNRTIKFAFLSHWFDIRRVRKGTEEDLKLSKQEAEITLRTSFM